MTPTDLAWMAGIHEGEGCVRITAPGLRNTGSLFVEITSTDFDLLEPFAAAWGGTIAAKRASGNRKPYWRWTCVSRKAAAYLEAIRPFCRVARVTTKIDLALEFQAQKVHDRTGAYYERQAEFHRQMVALNHRGL